jgi:phosphoglycerate kinase
MAKELTMLGGLLETPERPFAAVIGGAKVSGKLGVLENLITKVDVLMIGGGMAATFYKCMGFGVGTSIVEDDRLQYVRALAMRAKSRGVKLILPSDVIVTGNLDSFSGAQTVRNSDIPDGCAIADIGPAAIRDFVRELKQCRTVVWNGPMGVFEIPEFAGGTRALAEVLADLKAVTIIGGGSTAEAVTELGLAGKMTFVSTGGGASLELLSGKTLPGVAALPDR